MIQHTNTITIILPYDVVRCSRVIGTAGQKSQSQTFVILILATYALTTKSSKWCLILSCSWRQKHSADVNVWHCSLLKEKTQRSHLAEQWLKQNTHRCEIMDDAGSQNWSWYLTLTRLRQTSVCCIPSILWSLTRVGWVMGTKSSIICGQKPVLRYHVIW